LTGILIGALPLLGLLGTIIGLLTCFKGIASYGADGALLSGGIADALLTTQLGLVCAIPGWLLQTYIRSRVRGRDTLTAPV
jgi:biopolymer transport protein ExbB